MLSFCYYSAVKMRLLFVVFLTLVISTLVVRGYNSSDFYDDSSEPSVGHPEWMSSLNDSQSLSELSIPGSHDTVSFYGGDYVQTQSWSLLQQLFAGIRFLDIRCRHYYNSLPIYHGSMYQYTYFDAVLRDVLTFLALFPSEIVIMRVKGEYIAVGNNETMHQTVSKYLGMFPQESFWMSPVVPSVGQSRGKIVIIQDFVGSIIGIQYRSLKVEEHWNVFSLLWGEIEMKWDYIESHLNRSQRAHSAEFFLTFTNGAGFLAFPYAVAWRINRLLLDYVVDNVQSQGRLGIIGMDFPGCLLIEKIIETNFGAGVI